MPAHAVSAISVQIDQHTVEEFFSVGLNCAAQLAKCGQPWSRPHLYSGPSVDSAIVAVPLVQPRQHMRFAEQC